MLSHNYSPLSHLAMAVTTLSKSPIDKYATMAYHYVKSGVAQMVERNINTVINA